jgi:hypothetical protein
MCGKLAAGQALCDRPLIQAGGANAACVKGVPQVAALAGPYIPGARRPVATGAADSRPGGSAAAGLLYIKVYAGFGRFDGCFFGHFGYSTNCLNHQVTLIAASFLCRTSVRVNAANAM